MVTGYFRLASCAITQETFSIIKNISLECDKFIIGIPGRRVYARIDSMNESYNPSVIAEMWKDYDFVSDVVILGPEELTLQDAHKKFDFNVYYYGTEYGREYASDCKYARANEIKMIPLIPEFYTKGGLPDALSIALKNVQPDHKIVLFGTGKYFDTYMRSYGSKYKPAYAVDNDSGKWNTKKSGILIQNPQVLAKENPDKTLVVLCARDYYALRNQLMTMGDFNYRTLLFDSHVSVMDELAVSISQEQAYIKESQAALLSILKDFDGICQKENLNYYMLFGSMVGVARHEGFIPWDDDIDVAMTREDYLKLASVFDKYNQNGKYWFQNLRDWPEPYFTDCMVRIVDMTRIYPHKINPNVVMAENADIFRHAALDIYVCDSAFDNIRKHNIQMGTLKVIYNMCMGHRRNMDYSTYKRLGTKWVILMRLINTFGKLFPLKFLMKCYDSISQLANNKDTENYFMNGCSITCIERRFKKEFFGTPGRMKFEDMMTSVPSDIDGIMKATGYSDYMTFPPYRDWRPSHYFNSERELW